MIIESVSHRSKFPQRTGIRSMETFKLVNSKRLGLPVSGISHTYVPKESVNRAHAILNAIFIDSLNTFDQNSAQWFGQKEPFDRFNPVHGEKMKPIMYSDSRMKLALDILNLSMNNVEKLYIPWWVEVAANDAGYEVSESGILIKMGTRHSYESQMARNGVDLPHIHSLSVAGFVVTADGRIILGVRGGLNLSNTIYFAAGALGLHTGVATGEMSIPQFFVEQELRKEYGLRPSDVGSAVLLGRATCYGGDQDVSYVFVIQTPLTAQAVLDRHQANPDEDRKEHKLMFSISADRAGVSEFIDRSFQGIADVNLKNRPDDRRILLPQGGAPLKAYGGDDLLQMDILALVHSQPS